MRTDSQQFRNNFLKLVYLKQIVLVNRPARFMKSIVRICERLPRQGDQYPKVLRILSHQKADVLYCT